MLFRSMSLGDADVISSAFMKQQYEMYCVTQFPVCEDPLAVLRGCLNIDGIDVDREKLPLLRGRYRMVSTVITKLLVSQDKNLESAIDQTLRIAKSSFEQIVSDVAKKHAGLGIDSLFLRIVQCWDICKGVVDWEEEREGARTLVEYLSTIQRVERLDGNVEMRIAEPLVIEALRTHLSTSGNAAQLSESACLLREVVKELGPTCSAKGNLLEPVLRQALVGFNGMRLADAPFLACIRDQLVGTWAESAVFDIQQVGTSVQLGGRCGVTGDMQFLAHGVTGKMLVEQNQTRQDGVYFFDRTHALALGATISVREIGWSKHTDQVESTDIRKSFPSCSKIRKQFLALNGDTKLEGIVRIHIEFPRAHKKWRRPTEVDPFTGDIMVFINLENMDEFFIERAGNISWNNCIHSVKKLITSICQH